MLCIQPVLYNFFDVFTSQTVGFSVQDFENMELVEYLVFTEIITFDDEGFIIVFLDLCNDIVRSVCYEYVKHAGSLTIPL